MKFLSVTISTFLASASGAFAFSSGTSTAFVSTRAAVVSAPVPATSSTSMLHTHGCSCHGCQSRTRPTGTFLFMSDNAASTAEIPAEVEALDGVLSEDEQHNTERPARKSLKKKGPKGKPLSEFELGQTVKGRIKTIASYGAFVDIGAETDGLLHISQLSVDYVADVKDILELNKEYDVRITKIDEAKKQIALSLLTAKEEESAAENAAASRAPKRDSRRDNKSKDATQRRDDSAVLSELQNKGWDASKFVEGTVVSIVDFGAFVHIDCSQLNTEVAGELDGLVHISALSSRRVNSVSDIVKVNDKVQIRVKSIEKGKVSLSMVSEDDEQAKNEARSASGQSVAVSEGAADWKESLEKMQSEFPAFTNRPLVVDLRK